MTNRKDMIDEALLRPGRMEVQVMSSVPRVRNCTGIIKPDLINMTVFFCYLVQSDLSSVRYCKRVHWKSNFLLGTRNTWPCITGSPVYRSTGF